MCQFTSLLTEHFDLTFGQDTRNFRILKITMSQRFEFRFLLRDLGIFYVPLS